MLILCRQIAAFLLVAVVLAVLHACSGFSGGEEKLAKMRHAMVENQIRRRGIKDPKVLSAMEQVPRHQFVNLSDQEFAYRDGPLPIGKGQTISQPYIVAFMTEALRLKRKDRVLEVGTGSGYQAAVLGEIVEAVYSIEIIDKLAKKTEKRLAHLGYTNIHIKSGDGYYGWSEHAPYDGILVTAAINDIPPALIEQLKPDGRLVIPIGRQSMTQNLFLIEKKADGSVTQRMILPVAFVAFKH